MHGHLQSTRGFHAQHIRSGGDAGLKFGLAAPRRDSVSQLLQDNAQRISNDGFVFQFAMPGERDDPSWSQHGGMSFGSGCAGPAGAS